MATHDYVVLSLVTRGSLTMEQRERWTLRAGDVLVVPAGEPHRMLRSDKASLWGVGFCVACLQAEGDGVWTSMLAHVRGGASAAVTLPEERRGYVERLLGELEAEVARADAAWEVQKSLLTLLLTEVARAAGWSAMPSGGDVVRDALGYIERHCLGRLAVADVAKAVGRSPTYLTTLLKARTGRSVQEWVTANRMGEARKRLVHGDERVDVIAERVGYADVTHFIRTFRRFHGVTPAAYRKDRAVPTPR